jgi:hypothetical protein
MVYEAVNGVLGGHGVLRASPTSPFPKTLIYEIEVIFPIHMDPLVSEKQFSPPFPLPLATTRCPCLLSRLATARTRAVTRSSTGVIRGHNLRSFARPTHVLPQPSARRRGVVPALLEIRIQEICFIFVFDKICIRIRIQIKIW